MVSGAAGLVYEVLWSRYLGLFVGHGAYAQVLVLAVYLGGMAVGSFVLADASKRVRQPLVGYAGAEALLAAFGLVFHSLFTGVTELSYDRIFPALGSAGMVGSVRWGLAGLLILPQATILGATFPLMAASLVRGDPDRPGRGVARVYLLNTLGGAAGVLIAGFWMIGALGLPGTSAAAAAMNLAAAGLALATARRRQPAETSDAAGTDDAVARAAQPASVAPSAPAALAGVRPSSLMAVLLTVSLGSALASFAYEIAWVRMLSLVLGSATHSFEIMLSAFILGLAIGAWWIGTRTDRAGDPLRLLGGIQVAMGLAALASLPVLYFGAFEAVSWLVGALQRQSGGYALFNLSRYGLSLLVMLPTTVLAGMTLPVITGTLIRAGAGEAAIGRVYGVNTIGSVIGAALAGLLALPWIGLKGLIVAAAAIDVVLGLWLLERSMRWAGGSLRALAATTAVSAVVFAVVGLGVTLDQMVMSSGVYRFGVLPGESERVGLYYGDGRTATVSAHLATGNGIISLATNGKPDASLELRWMMDRRDTLPDRPIDQGMDITTQVLAPQLALAFNPGARNAANIGHGSGLSATSFLTSPTIERLVTVEIEPLMVEGSAVFMPVNAPALTDRRSSYVFDDAKSYFSYQRERFDVIFAEPSNPWVSGTASLFTVEFYQRMRDFLAEGGVLAQWMQIYELDDDLFLTMIAALDAAFPSYRAYLVGDFDVAIVARADGPLGEPDWSVLQTDAFLDLTEGVPPFRPEHLESLLLFDDAAIRPLLRRGVRPNSDYRPVLDLGAERARFEQSIALGVYGLATSRVHIARAWREDRVGDIPYETVPARGLVPALQSGMSAWLRDVSAAGGGIAPEQFPEWQNALVALEEFLGATRQDSLPTLAWPIWALQFDRSEADLHWGTFGWVDQAFYDEVYAFMGRADAPPTARAAVDLKHAFSLLEWERAADAADQLVSRVAVGEPWVSADILLDMAVIAYVKSGRPDAARDALELLTPWSGRASSDIRLRMLEALVAESEPPGAVAP